MQDFDLVDEQGRSIPIQVAGARLIARSNSPILGDDVQGQMLISSLDLPLSVEPLGLGHASRCATAIRSWWWGSRRRSSIPASPGSRQVPVRIAIASSSPRPMLVYPIAAERGAELGRRQLIIFRASCVKAG